MEPAVQDPAQPSEALDPVPADQFAPDFFYPEDHKETTLPDSSISSRLSKHYWGSGFDPFKRNNLQFLSDTELIMAVGHTYNIVNVETGEVQVFHGKDGWGIGAIAVHPTKQYFAVGEKGKSPNVYIYEFPSLKLYRVLRKGTEKAFSTIAWSHNGEKLATVGSDSDFMLTVWDWKQERVVLRSKAFGQEVYRVSFSPTFDQQITTSGIAHIRFWKMAKTFTGLKLQGDIGKFGQVELSDISGFAELPDGKVLTGSEYGNLLLWEGGLVKAVLTLSNGGVCHDGNIDTVQQDKDSFMSAGTDGYLKWWAFSDIDTAEPDEGYNVAIEPIRQVQIGGGNAKILNFIPGDAFNVAVDGTGKLWKVAKDFEQESVFMNFHAGAIAELAVSPQHNITVTLGRDGSTRLWDFINKKEVYQRQWSGKGTCLDWSPVSARNQGRVLAAGFDNGLLRVVWIGKEGFEVVHALKAHDKEILRVKYSRNGNYLFTIAADNTLFFYEVNSDCTLKPVAITSLDGPATDAIWDYLGAKVLISHPNGTLSQITRPESTSLHTDHSYEVELPTRKWTMRMMEFQIPVPEPVEEDILLQGPVKKQEVVIKEWDPAPVTACAFHPHREGLFFLAVDQPYDGYIYLCDMDAVRPLEAFECSHSLVTRLTIDEGYLISSHKDGSIELRLLERPNKWLEVRPHDSSAAVTQSKLSYNQAYLLTAGSDGTMFVTELYPKEFKEAAASSDITPDPPLEPKQELGIESLRLDSPVSIEIASEDLSDASGYSLQMEKLQMDEDQKRSAAEAKKDKKRKEIKVLREEFERVMQGNEALEVKYRLPQEELIIDKTYYDMLLKRNEVLLEEVQKEEAWRKEFSKLEMEKYKNYYLANVEVNKFVLHALRSDDTVASFRLTSQSDFLRKALQEIYEANNEEAKRGRSLHGSEYEAPVSPSKFSHMTAQQEPHSELAEEAKTGFASTTQALAATKKAQMSGKKEPTAQENREERTKNRDVRKAILAKHQKMKPSSTAYDPQDEGEIDLAKRTMGDYSLKTSPNYVVPESERVNAWKKRRQMIELINAAWNLKKEFNEQLLGLRQLKVRLIDKIKEHNERVAEVNAELRLDEEMFNPDFHPEEWPEKDYLVSADDVAGDHPLAPAGIAEYSEAPKDLAKKNKKQQTDKEKQYRSHLEAKLQSEKMALLAEIEKIVQGFDEAIKKQSLEREVLDHDLKQTEMRLITYFNELIKLEEIEPTDRELTARMEQLIKQKADLAADAEENAEKFERVTAESDEITAQLKKVSMKFNDLVPENSQFYEFLLKVLEKKIKRKKQKQKASDDEEEDDDDDDSEDMSDLSDDSSDESQDNLDVAPENLDLNLFESVQQLREERLDLTDQVMVKSKEIDKLKRDADERKRKENELQREITRTDVEIQEFQRLKMQKLNELEVAIVLVLDQFLNLDEDVLPVDMSDSVLFTNEALKRLRSRILELGDELKKAETRWFQLRKDKSETKKETKAQQREKEKALKEYESIMALKFGRRINLDLLSHAEPTAQVEELKEKFVKTEKKTLNRIEEAKAQLYATQLLLNQVMEKNTKLIERRTELFDEIVKSNKKLDLGNQEIFREEDESEQEILEKEKKKMKELLELQAREIETLKTEIGLFRHKGGHIYTKITTNRLASIQ